MFKESITTGPGYMTTQDYTLEIITILIITFIFGYVFRVLHNKNLKKKIATLQMENDLMKNDLSNRENESLLKTYQSQIETDKNEIDRLKLRASTLLNEKIDLQSSLNKLNAQLTAQKAEVDFMKNKINQLTHQSNSEQNDIKPFEENSFKEIETGKTLKSDLKKIEGIGPKIEQILNEGKIMSFQDLMTAEIDFLRQLLNNAGPTYAVHDPETWPEQAKLAFENDWSELESLQKELKAGKRVK